MLVQIHPPLLNPRQQRKLNMKKQDTTWDLYARRDLNMRVATEVMGKTLRWMWMRGFDDYVEVSKEECLAASRGNIWDEDECRLRPYSEDWHDMRDIIMRMTALGWTMGLKWRTAQVANESILMKDIAEVSFSKLLPISEFATATAPTIPIAACLAACNAVAIGVAREHLWDAPV